MLRKFRLDVGLRNARINFRQQDKGMDEIVENIAPTAEIIKIIKPVYNFKAE